MSVDDIDITAQHGRFPALKYRDFRLLWIGQFLSNAALQMQIVAINWNIYLLTNSAFALGLIGLMRFIPIVFMSLIGGTVADVFNRKKLLIITELCAALLSFILTITTLSNNITPLTIYTVTILLAVAMSFNIPARQALVPSLVHKNHLANAISLNVIMFQVSTIVGPMLAGLFIAKFSIGTVYGMQTMLSIATALLLSFLHVSGVIKNVSGTVSLSSIKEGILFVKSKTMIWSTMFLDFFSTFFASATALLPIFAKDILAVGPQGLGILYAAPAVGAVIAGYAIAHVETLNHQGKILLYSVALYGLATVLFGLSQSFIPSLAALALIGGADSISAIIRNTIRQITTPDYIRGRMTSINMIFFMGGPQLGEFEAGLLAALIGAPLSVVTGGIGTLFVVALSTTAIPALRRYDTHETPTQK